MTDISKQISTLTENWKHFHDNQQKTDEQVRNQLNLLEKKYTNLITSQERPYIHNQNTNDKSARQHFLDYIRKGNVHDNVRIKSAHISSGLSQDGTGILVSIPVKKEIQSSVRALCAMRKLASVEEISGTALDLPIQEEKFACGWVGETDNRPITESASIRMQRIITHQIYSQPKISQTLIDDPCVNVEEWLHEQLSCSFADKEEESFIRGNCKVGDAAAQVIVSPTGIMKIFLSEEKRKEREITGRKIDTSTLVNLCNKLSDTYHHNASFLMHRSTLSEIQKLADSAGRFLWQPQLGADVPETLLGKNVVCCDKMPKFPQEGEEIPSEPLILFGDFKSAYKIVDSDNISIQRDPFTQKPFVVFYAVKKTGGEIIDPNAVVGLRYNPGQ
ncbi:phage major capsid protein [Candidatus Sneabacter namystus]|uniref:Phage major capsid protein n=1 Tax=Candidatus Sneabacter namystus TaxID=2601646 RepID=A0A5C0UI45_9RICK|nr:phage major capsid protein [Candidatus Sneabacter namystus]QEK39746.1 phage major capsid protein [Candidatus Sneabacter namystus]